MNAFRRLENTCFPQVQGFLCSLSSHIDLTNLVSKPTICLLQEVLAGEQLCGHTTPGLAANTRDRQQTSRTITPTTTAAPPVPIASTASKWQSFADSRHRSTAPSHERIQRRWR